MPSPEELAREKIDALLQQCGWILQNRRTINLSAASGAAIREALLKDRDEVDLDDFVACYNPKNRHERKESKRFKSFTYEELTKRDKLNLDIFWLKDESLEDSANLPDPNIIAAEIVEDLEAALSQFATMAADLKK